MTSLIDLKTASEQLGLAKITIYKMVSARRIPHIKIGKRVLFDPQKLSEWIDEHKVVPVGKK